MPHGDRLGPYTLVRLLGRGAFGQVWLAERRTALAVTRVALKIPLTDDVDLDAIRKEASIWAQASGHPNVLPIIEADIYDGQVVIVSEYAPDGSLVDWLARKGGVVSLPEAARMVDGILAGLEHLHARQIVHRDLKPANVLLQGETPRLADFGIARVVRATSHTGHIAGTPAYMPPEAFDGVRTEQGDLWAAGVVFQQLITGGLPFPQPDLTSLMAAILTREPVPLPADFPPAVRSFLAMALCKDPSHRFATATLMRQALAQAVASATPVRAWAAPPATAPAPAHPATDGRAAAATVPAASAPAPVSTPAGAAPSAIPASPTADTLPLPPDRAAGSNPAASAALGSQNKNRLDSQPSGKQSQDSQGRESQGRESQGRESQGWWWIAAGVAVTLLLGATLFLALLVYFQGRASRSQMPPSPVPPVVEPRPSPAAPTASDTPAEPATAPPAPPTSLEPGSEGFYVVAFSAKTAQAAEARKQSCLKSGLQPFVVKTDDWTNFEPGFYIVALGIYATEAEANVAASLAKEKGISVYTKPSGPPRQPEAASPDAPDPDDIPGDFPEASLRDLTDDDLRDLTAEELRLMRNEILARHGYRFSDPELAAHFGAQPWYRPTDGNAEDKLTAVERRNIERIRKAEEQTRAAERTPRD